MIDLNKDERCEFIHLHTDIVDRARAALPDEEKQYELAELFAMFADTTRIRIIQILFGGEISVNDIAERLQLEQSVVSHQLRILRTANLIKPRREGRKMLYSLDDDHIGSIFKIGLSHILHKKVRK